MSTDDHPNVEGDGDDRKPRAAGRRPDLAVHIRIEGNVSPSVEVESARPSAGEPAQKKAAAEGPSAQGGQPAEGAQGEGAQGEGAKKGEGDGKAAGDGKQPPKKPAGPPWYRRPVLVGLLILVFIVAVVAIVLLWLHSRDYVGSDDAYIDAIPERVSPQVSGRVLRVLVDDNQDVSAGQVLVELDPADYRTRLDQSRAAEAQARAQLAQAQAQEVVLRAQLEQARANEGTAQVNADNAARDLARYQGLQSDSAGAVSAQQLDRSGATAASSAASLRAAHAAVAAAEAQLVYARSQIAAAQAGIGSAAAQARENDLTLSYTEVKARLDGRVANKSVTVGDFVSAGAALMAVVPRDVYVTADFKETQLDRMRAGQAVKIKLDAYPEVKISGHVNSVQPGTGQAFSLLPAENATGNWVKVVQRVPVKILIDQLPNDPGIRLAPGMSVEVSVAVR